ncbi:MAG: hypothetical protein ACI867_001847 [Glaciecola sp.]
MLRNGLLETDGIYRMDLDDLAQLGSGIGCSPAISAPPRATQPEFGQLIGIAIIMVPNINPSLEPRCCHYPNPLCSHWPRRWR